MTLWWGDGQAVYFGAARAVGFESISVDLIYGLPLQSTTGICAHHRDHRPAPNPIAFHCSITPICRILFKAQRQIDESQLPAPATKLAIFRQLTQSSA